MSSEENDLEARKNELFATITLLAGVKRDIIGARGARRFELIARQAQLEADKERLSHEVNAQYMYRNLQAFMNRVDAYDAARKEEAARQVDQIGGLRNGQTDLQAEFRTGLSRVAATVSTLTETVNDLQVRMRESQEDRRTLHNEIAAIKTQLSDYMAGSKRDEVEQIKADIRELRGPEMSPEQRSRYVAILLLMIAEWEAAHPDIDTDLTQKDSL